MTDDFENEPYQQQQIDNTRNVQLSDPSCLPEAGPYTIQMRDLLLKQNELEDLFASLEIQTTSIQVESHDAAANILGLNGMDFQECKLNARYWVPRTNRRGPREDRPQIDARQQFQNLNNVRGTEVKEFKDEGVPQRKEFERKEFKPVSFNRNEFGSEQQKQQEQQPQGQQQGQYQRQYKRQDEPKPQFTGFSREMFGSDLKNDKPEEKPKQDREKNVKIMFDRK